VVKLWDWILAPGDRHESEAHAPGTKELLQVQDVSVTVVVAGEFYLLEAGDAVSFPSDDRGDGQSPIRSPTLAMRGEAAIELTPRTRLEPHLPGFC
jgi:hypothetical protein